MPCRCALIKSLCDYCVELIKKERDDARRLLDEIASRAEAIPGGEELYEFTKWLNQLIQSLRTLGKTTPAKAGRDEFIEVMVSRYIQRVNRGPMEAPTYVDTVQCWTEAGSFSMGYDLWLNLFGVELEKGAERKLVKIPACIKTE